MLNLQNYEAIENFFEDFVKNNSIPIKYHSNKSGRKIIMTVIPKKEIILGKETILYAILDSNDSVILNNIIYFEIAEKICKLLCEGKNINHNKIYNLLKINERIINIRNEIFFINRYMHLEKNKENIEIREIRKEKLQQDIFFLLEEVKNYY